MLEPVQSAGDFEKFKQLMHNKNEELHYQALEMLDQSRGHFNSIEDNPDEDLKEAIRYI